MPKRPAFVIGIAMLAAFAGYAAGAYFTRQEEIKNFMLADAEYSALIAIGSVMYARLLRDGKHAELQANFDRDIQCAADSFRMRLIRDANSKNETLESAIAALDEYSDEYGLNDCEPAL